MHRRDFLKQAGLAAAALSFPRVGSQGLPVSQSSAGKSNTSGFQGLEKKPNFVLILADDLGYGDVGCYGATKIKTPNIDRLAAEGVRFTQAYCPGSVCSPTRYSLMSGRYWWRNPRHHPTGVHAPGGCLLFEPDRLTLAKLFKQNGYATAAVGKWHLGFGEGDNPAQRYDWSQEEIKPGPLEVGFDFFFGMAANVGNAPRIYIENHRFFGRKPGDKVEMIGRSDIKPWSPDTEFKEDHVASDIARRAVAFIERTPSDKPFFLYFASNITHNDITPAKEFLGSSQCGRYGDFIQELDAHVGWLLEALQKKGVLDNTLIIFTSDNGGVLPLNERLAAQWQARQSGHFVNGSLRGGKHSIYEGGFRVPFIVRWPDKHAHGTRSNAVICHTDVMATCAAILGQNLPEKSAGEDSFNALAAWQGNPKAVVRDFVVLDSATGIFAIRQGEWKLIERNPALEEEDVGKKGQKAKKAKANVENQNQLFNLATDPAEAKNLWDQHPDVVQNLTALLKQARSNNRTRP